MKEGAADRTVNNRCADTGEQRTETYARAHASRQPTRDETLYRSAGRSTQVREVPQRARYCQTRCRTPREYSGARVATRLANRLLHSAA